MVAEIGSTNADLVGRAPGRTRPEGTVLVAEHQVAGRGRLDRVWTSPPRAGLTVSFLLRPDVPAARRGWLPLLTGVALAEAVAEVTGVLPSLKWPNDLLAARRPQAGRDPRRELGRAPSSSASGSTSRRRPRSCPTPGRRWPGSPAATVDRGAGAAGLPARASSGATGAGRSALGDPVSSGLAAGLPRLVLDGRDRRSPSTCPTARRSRASREAVDWDGRLVVATAAGHGGARLRRRAARAPV